MLKSCEMLQNYFTYHLFFYSSYFSKYAILKNGTHDLSCTSHLWEKQDGTPEYWLAMGNLRYTVVTCVKGVYTKCTHCHVKNFHILRLSVGLQVFWDKLWSSKSFPPPSLLPSPDL